MGITAASLKVDVVANTSQAEKGITSFSGKLNNAAKNMAVVGGGLTAAITAPLLGIATAAVSSAAEFEQNMNILQEVVGATASDMAAMQAEALRLGAVTSFSAGEAAAAMLELGKAGMGTQDIMASIGGVMDLAAAGGIGLADAATYIATSLNAFGLEASEATRIADLFAAGANASSIDVAGLAKGVQNAGFAFAAAGWPIEDLVTSMAILSNVGLTASDASTALKNAIMQMISPTQQAADLAKELGISFFDAQGTMLSEVAIIEQLNTAFIGMTDQQRNAALATLFMSDGMKAIIPLLDQGASGFNKTQETVMQFGASSEAAGARMKGLSGGIEYLKGSVDSFLIGAALPFLDTLGGLARGAGDAITSFGALPAPIINATLAFLGIVAAAGPLLLLLSSLAGAFSFLIGPVGLVLVAVAALGAAWTANLGGIQEITASAMGSAQEWFTSTAAAAQQLASSISTAFSKTTFPSIEQLWSDFQAGDFEAIAEKIKSTAYELMVNLDAELNITGKAQDLAAILRQRIAEIDQWGLQMIDAIGLAIGTIDWSKLSFNAIGMLNALATRISSIDWTSLGSSLATNLGTVIGSAFSQVGKGQAQWSMQLDAAFNQAIASIDWGGLWAGSGVVEASIRQAVADFETGFAAGLADLPKLEWATYVDSLTWADFVPEKMAWATYVDSLGWDDFVPSIDWASFVPSINWASFIQSISWGSFIPSISWGSFIPSMDWGSFVGFLDWGRFVPRFFGGGGGESPSNDSPGVDSGGSIGGGGNGPGSGEAVISGVTVNVASISSDMDIHVAAAKLAREFQRRLR